MNSDKINIIIDFQRNESIVYNVCFNLSPDYYYDDRLIYDFFNKKAENQEYYLFFKFSSHRNINDTILQNKNIIVKDIKFNSSSEFPSSKCLQYSSKYLAKLPDRSLLGHVNRNSYIVKSSISKQHEDRYYISYFLNYYEDINKKMLSIRVFGSFNFYIEIEEKDLIKLMPLLERNSIQVEKTEFVPILQYNDYDIINN